jgi:uncharacterized protein
VEGRSGHPPPWVRANREGGTLVAIWVVPGASRTGIAGAHGDALKVRVSVPPESGRANRAVEELLSGLLGSPVTVILGPASRRKTVEVPGLAPHEVVGRLDR